LRIYGYYYITLFYLKKLTAILFFTVYLFSATEAHQLLKLPIIFQHYKEHKEEDKNISFLYFLNMHYMHGSPVDDDYDRDMQLPFKSTGDCLSSASPCFVPSVTDIPVIKAVVITKKKNIAAQQSFLIAPYLSAIWQPPKFC
jgi:hypothetical protein